MDVSHLATMGIVGSTWATMEYHAWYIAYDGGLLVVIFAQLGYTPGTICTMSYVMVLMQMEAYGPKKLFGTKSMANT